MNTKFKCITVSREAFDNEKVILENADAKVILHLKKDHGAYQEGKEYSLALATPASKTPAKKTPAKKTK